MIYYENKIILLDEKFASLQDLWEGVLKKGWKKCKPIHIS
jgi:hypothetical protein